MKTSLPNHLAPESAEQGSKRDYEAERKAALFKTSDRIADLAVARNDQSLGDEYIKLAQAMILCSLPLSSTNETKITRRARMGDGSTLSVTFTASADGIAMPFGADRQLLFWLLDRAIRSDSRFIPWSSAAEFRNEVGMSKSGRTNKQIRERFARISGLVISISRRDTDVTGTNTFALIERSYLPTSITNTPDDGQGILPAMGDRFGVLINEPFFADIKRYNIAMPRRLWLDMKGPIAVQDLVFWLYYRCYSAASETVIPWKALEEQFPNDDTNDRRIRQNMKKAIRVLKALWPDAQVREAPSGIWVDRAKGPMLDDDPTKKRQRRLS